MTSEIRSDQDRCQAFREQFDEWRRGDLPVETVQTLERHIAECEACADELSAAEQLGELLRASDRVVVLDAQGQQTTAYFASVTTRVKQRLEASETEQQAQEVIAGQSGATVVTIPARQTATLGIPRHYIGLAAAAVLLIFAITWVLSKSPRSPFGQEIAQSAARPPATTGPAASEPVFAPAPASAPPAAAAPPAGGARPGSAAKAEGAIAVSSQDGAGMPQRRLDAAVAQDATASGDQSADKVIALEEKRRAVLDKQDFRRGDTYYGVPAAPSSMANASGRAENTNLAMLPKLERSFPPSVPADDQNAKFSEQDRFKDTKVGELAAVRRRSGAGETESHTESAPVPEAGSILPEPGAPAPLPDAVATGTGSKKLDAGQPPAVAAAVSTTDSYAEPARAAATAPAPRSLSQAKAAGRPSPMQPQATGFAAGAAGAAGAASPGTAGSAGTAGARTRAKEEQTTLTVRQTLQMADDAAAHGDIISARALLEKCFRPPLVETLDSATSAAIALRLKNLP